jgi:hypothetical protein
MPNITDAEINAYLDSKKVPHVTMGRTFLLEAIKEKLRTPGWFLITEVYASIALKYDTTSGSVERAIRFAIMRTGEFITNKEFICRAADDLLYGKSRPE